MSETNNQTTQTQNQQSTTQGSENQFVYDEWFKGLDEATQKGLSGHFDETTKGLKSALESERASVRELNKQLKELTSKAEKGSELERQLTEISGRLTESEQRAAFYDAAVAAGCVNPRLAYLAAKDGGLFLQNGQPNIEAVKQAHPQLFEKPVTGAGGGAGSGTNQNANQGQGTNAAINAALRHAAGLPA